MNLSDISTAWGAARVLSTGKLIIYAIAIAVMAAIIGGAGGAWLGYDYGHSKGKAEVETLKTRHATALAQAHDTARREYQVETERGNKAERALVAAKQQFAAERKSLLRRINDVTTVYQPAPGAVPVALPRAVFTAGFVQFYNAAIGVPGNQTPAAAGGAGDTPATGATADAGLLDSGISQADILAHVADYGERCQGLAAQVNGLLDLHEGKGSP
ncbi:MAG: lysis protein [Burkholderiaceae bacterium]|nr:lysis protein [Burkholderiaceae bacterium]